MHSPYTLRHAPPPNRPSRGGHQSVWLYGRHAVLAALANPERRLERLLATRDVAERHAAEFAGKSRPRSSRATIWRSACPPAPSTRGSPPWSRRSRSRSSRIVLARCGDDALVLALDQVTDPHNVGAILRSAAAFGVAGLIVTERHAPADTGVLAKAASGALEIVPLVRAVNLARTLDQLKEAGFWLYGLDESGDARDRRPRPRRPRLHRARRRGRRPAPADRREMRPAGDDSDRGGAWPPSMSPMRQPSPPMNGRGA